jgi:hypothetical protein
MLSKQKPKFKKVLLLLLLLLSAHEHFSTLHTLTTLAKESPHSKRVCLCVWFPRGPPQERVAEGLLWGRRRGETTRQRQSQCLQRWSSKTGERERERERTGLNQIKSNKTSPKSECANSSTQEKKKITKATTFHSQTSQQQ